MKVESAKDGSDRLKQLVRGFYDNNLTALNSIIDVLPEGLKKEFAELRAALNKQLDQLPMLDAVPAANEIGWIIQRAESVIQDAVAYHKQLVEKVNGVIQKHQTTTSALHSLELKMSGGELLDKAKHETALNEARADERKKFLPELLAARKNCIELAGLPAPGEDVLGLPAAEFESRRSGAAANAKKLAERNITAATAPTLFAENAWLEEEAFNASLKRVDEIAASQKGGGKGGTGGGGIDPLRGAGGGGGASEALSLGVI